MLGPQIYWTQGLTLQGNNFDQKFESDQFQGTDSLNPFLALKWKTQSSDL